MLTQEPSIRLTTCQSDTVDTALLTGTNADSLTIHSETDRVRLCVLQSNQGNNQVNLCAFGNFLVLSNHILQKLIANLKIVATLLECDTEDLLVLNLSRNKVRIDCNHIVSPLTLCLQNLQGLIGIAGSNNTIRNLPGDQLCSHSIASIRQSDPIAKGAQTVRTAGTGISTSQRVLIKTFNIVNKASLLKISGQNLTNRCRGRRNMLKGCSSNHAGCSLQFLNQLPGVQRIHEIDITGAAIQNRDRQFTSIMHVKFCRLLIRVAAIFQFKLFHFHSLL